MTFVFWTLVAVLTAGVLYRILKPLLSPDKAIDRQGLDTREQQLINVYRERLQLLEQQHGRSELDDEQFSTARDELESSLAAELPESGETYQTHIGKWLPIALGVTTPALALAIYFSLGSPAVVDGPPKTAARPDGMPSIDAMVAGLEEKLRQNPENVEGWRMLGRSYETLGEFEKARDAYSKAVQRAPADSDLLLRLAEATAATQGNSLIGEPESYIDLALQIDPSSRQVRWLQGILAFQKGTPEDAVILWEKLLQESSNKEEQQLLSMAIEEARHATSGVPPSSTSDKPQPQDVAPPQQGPSVHVFVKLDESLHSKVEAGDVLFVYAKAETGPPMPLAIVRTTAADLPLEVVLTDEQAMMPQMKLSSFPRVVVGARISKTGDAIAKSGDLQGVSAAVDPAQSPSLNIVIDSIIP